MVRLTQRCCRNSHLRGLFALALSRWAGAQDLAIASPVGHRQGTQPQHSPWTHEGSRRYDFKTCDQQPSLNERRET